MDSTKGTKMQNLKIQGREFIVTTTDTMSMPYMLTGARGAVYGAFRFPTQPDLLWIANYKAGELRIKGNRVLLTDKDGDLRAAR